MARIQAQTIQKDYDIHRFQTASVEDMPFHKEAIEVIVSSAVLHFPRNTEHFYKMLDEMMRILKPSGLLFLRMATGLGGMLEASTSIGGGIYLLPDGSKRFLLTEALLAEIQDKYDLHHLEAPKSVLVHGKRSMGVFMMQIT